MSGSTKGGKSAERSANGQASTMQGAVTMHEVQAMLSQCRAECQKGKGNGKTGGKAKGDGKSSAAKSKGKGKGKSQEKSEAQKIADGWWQCPSAACKAWGGGAAFLNRPDRSSCMKCWTPWKEAEPLPNPLADLRAAAAAEVKDTKKSKKAPDAEPPAKEEPSKPPADEKMDGLSGRNPLLVTTTEFDDTNATLLFPRELREGWKATEVRDHFMPKSVISTKESILKEIESTNWMINQ